MLPGRRQRAGPGPLPGPAPGQSPHSAGCPTPLKEWNAATATSCGSRSALGGEAVRHTGHRPLFGPARTAWRGQWGGQDVALHWQESLGAGVLEQQRPLVAGDGEGTQYLSQPAPENLFVDPFGHQEADAVPVGIDLTQPRRPPLVRGEVGEVLVDIEPGVEVIGHADRTGVFADHRPSSSRHHRCSDFKLPQRSARQRNRRSARTATLHACGLPPPVGHGDGCAPVAGSSLGPG